MMIKIRDKLKRKEAMTLIEVLLVVGLVSIISLALYNGLSTGIKVWERSRVSVKEEEIVIFFDKLTRDLHNSYFFLNFPFQGTENRLIFPTVVLARIGGSTQAEDAEYTDQLGEAEYFYDLLDNVIYRRQLNYAQATHQTQIQATVLVTNVDSLKFRYYYITGDGELYNSDFLDTTPIGLEVEVQFTDTAGQRSLKKYIDIPIGG